MKISKDVARPALARLVEAAKEGKVGVLLVVEADRLARNNLDVDGFSDADDRFPKPG
jgi:DNA invertase Pin-like site-specific DNA recombinase